MYGVLAIAAKTAMCRVSREEARQDVIAIVHVRMA